MHHVSNATANTSHSTLIPPHASIVHMIKCSMCPSLTMGDSCLWLKFRRERHVICARARVRHCKVSPHNRHPQRSWAPLWTSSWFAFVDILLRLWCLNGFVFVPLDGICGDRVLLVSLRVDDRRTRHSFSQVCSRVGENSVRGSNCCHFHGGLLEVMELDSFRSTDHKAARNIVM